MTADLPRPRSVAPSVSVFEARTPTLPPATHTNSYALGDREVVLVEPATPYEDERRAWVEWARAIASEGRRIVAIVATHHHPDHVGGAGFFRDAIGVPLWAHRATAERIDVPVDRMLDEGDAIVLEGPRPSRWDVLHTPGHAPGHVTLHDREHGTLVVGDMVASTGTILIAPGDGDMRAYLEQLRRLSFLQGKTALPAHGGPIAEPSKLFDHYVAHRLAREAMVLGALATKGAVGGSVDDLVPLAYADVAPAVWPIARLSLEAHLEKLVGEGRARRDGAHYFAEAA